MPRHRISTRDTLMLRVKDPVHPNLGTGVSVLGALLEPPDVDRDSDTPRRGR